MRSGALNRIGRGVRFPACLLVLAATLVVASPAGADPVEIRDKQAEARRVLAEVQQLDSEVSHAIEAYNAATLNLDGIRHSLAANRRDLPIARANLRRSQQILARHLVALYLSGAQENSTLEVMLGSRDFGDVLDRLYASRRVSELDATVVRQVRTFRQSVEAQRRRLERARAGQARVVAERASRRSEIESRLAERRRLLASVEGEIARLQAQERARQAELARRAAARLAAQEAEQRRALQESVVGVTAVAPVASAEGVQTVVAVAPPSQYGGVVGIAMRYLGIPYKWGGASPSEGFDCSGFVMYVYAQVGVSLPHYTGSQFQLGTPVSRDQLEPGDLVFFDNLGHNGIYIGGDQFIHAPHTGDVVKISSMSDAWYASKFDGGRRL